MTEPVTLAGEDALFIADVLHLASRLLKSGHSTELGRLAAGLTRAAARRLPPGSPWTRTDDALEESILT
jgi:hypothetical protein